MPSKSPYLQIHGGSRLFDLLPGVYYHLKFQGRWEIVDVTDQTIPFLGYNPTEIYAMPHDFLSKIIHPEDLSMVNHRKKQVFQSDKLFVDEYRIVTKASEMKFVKDQYTCFQDDAGVWIMEGYLSEIHHSTIKDRLLQQLQAYRNAVDVNMISSITNRSGKIVYANENFCRVSKYAQWELIGKNHRIVNSGHHPVEFFAEMWKTISSGRLWHGEILNKAKDGTLYWVETVIMPIFDEDKNIINYLSLRILIDDRKEAELQRKNHVDLLEKIAFMVAHNVRGPLCSILGLTNILTNYSNTQSEIDRCLKYLGNSAAKLNDITQMLSQFVNTEEVGLRNRFTDSIEKAENEETE